MTKVELLQRVKELMDPLWWMNGRTEQPPMPIVSECLHFREVGKHGQHKKLRSWACIDCNRRIVLHGSVFNLVAIHGGKWRRKK